MVTPAHTNARSFHAAQFFCGMTRKPADRSTDEKFERTRRCAYRMLRIAGKSLTFYRLHPEPSSLFNTKARLMMRVTFALLVFGLCGCASHLATVKTIPARLTTGLHAEGPLDSATKYLLAAEHEQPSAALGHDLLAAKISQDALERRPNDASALGLYNFAAARTVQNVERANLQPWRHPVNVVTDQGTIVLTSPKPVDLPHDPGRYEKFPVDTLRIGGTFFENHQTKDGVGAPVVVVERTEDPKFRREYRLARIYASMTATVKSSGHSAELDFVNPLITERASVDHHVFHLAADYDASIAVLMARERPDRIGFARLMNPEAYASTTRLFQLQQFDPNRTPVIFVHGLQDTPASWTPMINALRNDPAIRKRYQFWFFTYPSGYPYPYSAALLRRDLDGIKRAFPARKPIVLIGHSMGGMISRLMVTDAGDKIWRAFFGTSPSQTQLPADVRRQLQEVFVFNHRPEVRRVIFISTPHRGSALATSWVGRLGASFVKKSRSFESEYAAAKPLLVADPEARSLKRMPNSVDTLEPNDRFVKTVNKIPITPGIPYHSIIGDRGRGDTPNSSDGVVQYWSSHLDGAQSEKIVPSNHAAPRNPEAIREVERILKENLTVPR
jgi:pimeloyl-ACP methyl ester carboxylesterase